MEDEEPIHVEHDMTMPKASLVGHLLIQTGPLLVCRSCPYEHSYSIPVNMEYKGNDSKGMPILEPFAQ